MKSSLIFSFLLGALIISGCRKDDNPKVPDFDEVPIPLITLTGGTKIPVSDPASYNASLTVDSYFKFGVKPKQLDLVVIKNGDNSNPQVVQSGITTYPTTVNITGQQLADLFGSTPVLDDEFTFGANVTTLDGRTYNAFPSEGIPYAPGIDNLPGSSTQISLVTANFCIYDPAAYTEGDYEVVADDWGFTAPGDIVTVTKIDDTHFSFQLEAVNDPQPIIMEIDPVTNQVTVAPTMFGSFDYGTGDGPLENTTKTGAGSEADPCDTSFKLFLNYTIEIYGDQGDYAFVMKKV